MLEEDAERAQFILSELDHRPYTDADEKAVSCPKCGSTEVYNGIKLIKGEKNIL